jgi:hypothetical protein
MKYVLPFFAFCALLASSCSKDNGNANCTATKSFASDVSPIIQTTCATNSGCHAAGSVNSGGVLTTYSQIAAKKSDIKSQVQSGAMPQTGTLTSAQKDAIICWIDQGAPNN